MKGEAPPCCCQGGFVPSLVELFWLLKTGSSSQSATGLDTPFIISRKGIVCRGEKQLGVEGLWKHGKVEHGIKEQETFRLIQR